MSDRGGAHSGPRHPLQRCRSCGRDLASNSGETCAACGSEIPAPLIFHDALEFFKARTLLEAHDLVIDASDFGGFLGPFGTAYGLVAPTGTLWVERRSLDRANDLLEDAGIASPLGALPIVDRHEPVCARCEGELDPSGPEQCPKCGSVFQWIDIDEPEVDRHERECRACGYLLTGTESPSCPECGHPVYADVDDLVKAAAKNDSAPELAPKHGGIQVIAMIIGAIVVLFFVIALLQLTQSAQDGPDVGESVGLAFIFLGVLIVLAILVGAVIKGLRAK